MDLVDAQQARRILDRLGWLQHQSIAVEKSEKGLSAGRVQSIAVQLIIDREKEIAKFIPEEYWTSKNNFSKGNDQFEGQLIEYQGKKVELSNENDVTNIVKQLDGNEFSIF